MCEVKTFKEMSKEEQEAYLAKRREESAQRYNAIKAQNDAMRQKRKAFKAKVHAGNQFINTEVERLKEDPDAPLITEVTNAGHVKTPLIQGGYDLGGFGISFGILPVSWTDENVVVKAAYCIKSPTDEHKPNVAMGLIGHRIGATDEWCATLEVPRDAFECDPQIIRKAVASIIDSRILLRAPEVPQRVINTLFRSSIKAFANKQCKPCNKPDCSDCCK